MSPAARSVQVFGLYLLVLGTVLMAVPNPLLTLFGLPATDEVWIRVVGMLVVFLGGYYHVAATTEFMPFLVASVLFRASVSLFFAVFVLAGWAGWPLLLFGVVDLAAAAWTWLALPPRRPGPRPGQA